MKITSKEIQKNNPHRFSVFIDGKYAFGIDEEDWFRLKLYVGKELAESDIEEINEQCNFTKAKKQAIKYILYKARTSFEVVKKLEILGYDEDIIEKVVQELKSLSYIDDELYVEKYIKDAINLKKYGNHRIKIELQRKGIKDDIINKKLEELNIDEKEQLRFMIEKRINRYQSIELKTLNKLRSYFIRRGYNLSDINNLLQEILDEREIEIIKKYTYYDNY